MTKAASGSNVERPGLSGGVDSPFELTFDLVEEKGGISIYELTLASEQAAIPPPLTISWRMPAVNIKGVWTPNSLYEKRLRADWEEPDIESRISVGAPVLCLFGHQDENRTTFAWSDAKNTVSLSAPVREEDNLIYCKLQLFAEDCEPVSHYTGRLRIDARPDRYCAALQRVGHWWESVIGAEKIAPVPAATYDPIYSTWYNYHQEINPDELIREGKLAKEMGYGTMIVDDGWQTLDNRRGYDYTGDWEPERFHKMRDFVDQVHESGLKVMIWYSVPFCGKKSKAYQRFKGKMLTENHRWAPVFDPRYPEIRAYLVSKYVKAVTEWDLDGLKLDFIDDFRTYPDTPAGQANGRDCSSVNHGVSLLVEAIVSGLQSSKADLLIEFRQRYVGPELRRLGNLFRAFDCPNDSATNRLRTTDVRLVGGSSVTTGDMITWHPDEPVELAALQLLNTLFSVPQLSVILGEQSEEQLEMIAFWTAYYNRNRELLLSNHSFRAHSPLENYPLITVDDDSRMIAGLFGQAVINYPKDVDSLEVINGKANASVLLRLKTPLSLSVMTWDCRGRKTTDEQKSFAAGINEIMVPSSGLLALKITN